MKNLECENYREAREFKDLIWDLNEDVKTEKDLEEYLMSYVNKGYDIQPLLDNLTFVETSYGEVETFDLELNDGILITKETFYRSEEDYKNDIIDRYKYERLDRYKFKYCLMMPKTNWVVYALEQMKK